MISNNRDDGAFLIKLTNEIVKNLPNWYGKDNWDKEILPFKMSHKDQVFSWLSFVHRSLFKEYTLLRRKDFSQVQEILADITDSISGLSYFYNLLQDEYSRSLLIVLLAHRKMGYRKVKLPLNTPEYWNMRESAFSLVTGKESLKLKFRDFVLQHIDLNDIGFPLEIFYIPGGVAVTFILKQYEYQKRRPSIKAQPDDYVIDAGGCWGDTALYFADTIGPKGKVFTFEFSADNLEVLTRNLEINPGHAERIEVIPLALWDKSGEEINYSLNGPATALKNDPQGNFKVATITIDDFVKEKRLPKVNFIKMDIEGAELKALRGAEQTLRNHKPALAISLYHKDEDFIEIPQYLNSLNLGYKFYLEHFTIYRSETILFADCGIN